ncbi:MAG: nitronate monooxygenase [Thermoanaerobaculia bacterium]|nr:nitronate monooxygenase [Thermoanaerobaculia bacterium]
MTAEPAASARLATPFTRHAGVEVPLICGPMYPCSNPELVAAASAAGALGVLQPMSLTHVHGHDFRDGIRLMRRLSGGRPLGMNALIEQSSRIYHERMVRWVDQALEEGVRFFITSLGKPGWVVEKVHEVGGVVYHDVTERKWALKGIDGGVDGLIAVNDRAGGHAGGKGARELYEELADLGLPVVCAGGIASPERFVEALEMGYAAVQMGTRFIATTECNSAEPYKRAILDADEEDIVLSERITGVPVSVIRTPYIERMGTRAGPFARWMLRGRRRKHWMRTLYALKSIYQLKRSSLDESGSRDYWQAGKSVADVHEVLPAGEVVRRFAAAAAEAAG